MVKKIQVTSAGATKTGSFRSSKSADTVDKSGPLLPISLLWPTSGPAQGWVNHKRDMGVMAVKRGFAFESSTLRM